MGSKVAEKVKGKLEETLDRIVNAMDKTHRGAVMRLGKGNPAPQMSVVSSGSLTLDRALGVGGYPTGRIVEIYGPESSGKTTLCLHAIAEAQRAGGVAAFIDAEHALDVEYAGRLGVDIESLLIVQPDCGEDALNVAEALMRTGDVSLIVIDSVAALVPRVEIEGETGDQHMGLQARMMSQGLRKLTGAAHTSGTTVMFINQLRQKIGVTFGSNETTTGGNALKFYTTVRLDIRRIQTIKKGDQAVGARARVKVVKNKVAAPFRQAEFDIVFGRGVDREAELVDLAEAGGALSRSGSWYSLGDERLGQGRDALVARLRDDHDLRARVEALVSGGASGDSATPAPASKAA